MIHDGNDEIDDMKETNDVIPVSEEKILASLGYVQTLLLLQIMKISKYLKIWQISTYDIKKNRNTKQMQSKLH